MIIHDNNDTICAISTAPGVGGIAVARISGPRSIEITDTVWHGKPLANAATHTAHLGRIIDPATGDMLDQAVATIFRAPGTFTGEDVVELSIHGSKFIQRELIHLLMRQGCRLAEPGEFTRRAYASGRMGLTEAEAVADLIASNSRAAHRIAVGQMRGGFSRKLAQLREQLVNLASLLELELDFSEEEVEFASREQLINLATQLLAEINRLHGSFAAGNAIKEGIPVAIVGATNAGKSSLLNALLGDDRAIVSDIHGTTRDTIEETIEIGEFLFRFIDTAGLRDTTDKIEQIGIERSLQAASSARIVIAVSDVSTPLDIDTMQAASSSLRQSSQGHFILALNKMDKVVNDEARNSATDFVTKLNDLAKGHAQYTEISAKTGQGIDNLRQSLLNAAKLDRGNADEDILVTNARHAEALMHASTSCTRTLAGLQNGLPGDLVAQDLRETLHHLATITGDIPTSEILATIFSRFCIGK